MSTPDVRFVTWDHSDEREPLIFDIVEMDLPSEPKARRRKLMRDLGKLLSAMERDPTLGKMTVEIQNIR